MVRKFSTVVKFILSLFITYGPVFGRGDGCKLGFRADDLSEFTEITYVDERYPHKFLSEVLKVLKL